MTSLILEDVDDTLMSELARIAELNRLSIEAQAKTLLREALPIRDRSKLVERANAIAAMTPKGVVQTDSVELLREDRNR